MTETDFAVNIFVPYINTARKGDITVYNNNFAVVAVVLEVVKKRGNRVKYRNFYTVVLKGG